MVVFQKHKTSTGVTAISDKKENQCCQQQKQQQKVGITGMWITQRCVQAPQRPPPGSVPPPSSEPHATYRRQQLSGNRCNIGQGYVRSLTGQWMKKRRQLCKRTGRRDVLFRKFNLSELPMQRLPGPSLPHRKSTRGRSLLPNRPIAMKCWSSC